MARACEQCGGPLASCARVDARYCSGACRAAASRERRAEAHTGARGRVLSGDALVVAALATFPGSHLLEPEQGGAPLA